MHRYAYDTGHLYVSETTPWGSMAVEINLNTLHVCIRTLFIRIHGTMCAYAHYLFEYMVQSILHHCHPEWDWTWLKRLRALRGLDLSPLPILSLIVCMMTRLLRSKQTIISPSGSVQKVINILTLIRKQLQYCSFPRVTIINIH